MGGRPVLIVEDDEAIATGLAMNLRLEGFLPEVADDGEQGEARWLAGDWALVLLDIGLPKKNGLEVLREVRERGNVTPVIVLSAREGEYDKVAALRLGADDYVTKPFALAELIARVVAVLRRTDPKPNGGPQSNAPLVRFSDVVVNPGTRTVHKGGELVKLTHLEFELLWFFWANPLQVYTREELLKRVWGVTHGGSKRTVDNFVAQLRQKLEDDAEAPRHFLTVRGSGYRFEP